MLLHFMNYKYRIENIEYIQYRIQMIYKNFSHIFKLYLINLITN